MLSIGGIEFYLRVMVTRIQTGYSGYTNSRGSVKNHRV